MTENWQLVHFPIIALALTCVIRDSGVFSEWFRAKFLHLIPSNCNCYGVPLSLAFRFPLTRENVHSSRVLAPVKIHTQTSYTQNSRFYLPRRVAERKSTWERDKKRGVSTSRRRRYSNSVRYFSARDKRERDCHCCVSKKGPLQI